MSAETNTTTRKPIYLSTWGAGVYRLTVEFCGEDDGTNPEWKDQELLDHELDNGEFETDKNSYGNKRYEAEKRMNNLEYYADTLRDLEESFENFITCLEIRQKLKKQRVEFLKGNENK